MSEEITKFGHICVRNGGVCSDLNLHSFMGGLSWNGEMMLWKVSFVIQELGSLILIFSGYSDPLMRCCEDELVILGHCARKCQLYSVLRK